MSRSVGERVASNATLLIVSRILSRLIGLAVILLVTRLLGAAEFGKFSFAFSFVGLFVVIVGGGLNPLLTRETARHPERAGELLACTLLLKAGLLAVGFAALFLSTRALVDDPASRSAIYLAAVSVFSVSFTTAVNGISRAFQRMQYEVFGFVVGKLILLGLCLSCYVNRVGLETVVAAFAAASLVELGTSLFFVRARLVTSGYTVTGATVRFLLNRAPPFALSAVLGVIYFRIDMVMVRFLKGDLATGWYGGAYRFIEAVLFVPELMAGALFPVLARKFIQSEPLTGILTRSFRLFLVLALPFALGATVLPRITRVLGGDFGGSEEVLPFLGWTMFFMFLNFLLVTALNAAERQSRVMIALGGGAVANVVLNLLLVPRWGHVGAGIATLLSTVLVFAVEWRAVGRAVGSVGLTRFIVKPLLAGVSAAAVWRVFGEGNLLWVVPAGGAVYAAVLIALGGLPREDWDLLKGALRGARSQASEL